MNYIKYKNKLAINLDKIVYIEIKDENNSYTYRYIIIFNSEKMRITWSFKEKTERDEVYNLILNETNVKILGKQSK